MPELNDIAVLVRVVEVGSFAKVARELRVPTSTVARAVARLEESLEMRLLQRTTRSLTATSEGRSFYEEVASAVATIQRAARNAAAAADQGPRGVLRVAASNDVGTWLLAPAIVELTTHYPLVRVELELSSRSVNLVEEGYDVAIRLGPLHDSSLVSMKVMDLRAHLYASAGYVEENGAPRTPEELSQHPCILFRVRESTADWLLDGPSGRVKQSVRGRIASDDHGAIRAMVLEGAGIGKLPLMTTAEDLREGRLVRVLEDYESELKPIHYVHESKRTVAPKVVVFRELLVKDMARRELAWRIVTRTGAAKKKTKS